MTNSITYCDDHPIKTDIADWMNEHIGRASVGRDKEDYYEILAYSDQKSDRPELQRMAKREKRKGYFHQERFERSGENSAIIIDERR